MMEKPDSATPQQQIDRRPTGKSWDDEPISELPEAEVRHVARPAGTVAEQPRPEGRFQKSTLSFGMSALLVLCGSGGILAEIFHTSQAFQKGRARYASEANKGTENALGEYWKDVTAALQSAEQDTVRAKNNAIQIELSARADVRRIIEQALNEAAAADQLAAIQRHEAQRWVGPYFTTLNVALWLFETSLGPGHEIKLLVRKRDKERGMTEAFVSVPWNANEVQDVEAIECFTVEGFRLDSCTPKLLAHASTVDAFPRAKEEPKQADLAAVPDELKKQLGAYRRALEDLEDALFYNALDLRRYKAHNQSDESQTLDEEASRVNAGLQNVRKRFFELDDVKMFIERSENRESMPGLEAKDGEGFVFRLAVTTEKGQSPSAAIGSWLAKLPSLTRSARAEKAKEIQVRSTGYYQSLRPVLANVWATWTLGKMAPAVVLGLHEPAVGLPKQSSGLFGTPNQATELWQPSDQGISSRWVLFAGAVLTVFFILGLFFGFRGLPTYGRLPLLGVALISVLALAFPIQHAFTVNQESEEHSSLIASQVIPTHLRKSYTQRGADVARLIRVAGTDRASSIEESAKAASALAIAKANTEATALKQVATVQGARTFSFMNVGYPELTPSCNALEPGSLKAKCLSSLEAAGRNLKGSIERSNQ